MAANWRPSRYFVSDWCFRCTVPFLDRQPLALVVGNANAKYRDIAIGICADCVTPQFDAQLGFGGTFYKSDAPLELLARRQTRPDYRGTEGMIGFARLSHLDDGTYRVALHRGHVEVWTPKQRNDSMQMSIEGTGYNGSSPMFGTHAKMLFGSNARLVREVFWIDLSAPKEAQPAV